MRPSPDPLLYTVSRPGGVMMMKILKVNGVTQTIMSITQVCNSVSCSHVSLNYKYLRVYVNIYCVWLSTKEVIKYSIQSHTTFQSICKCTICNRRAFIVCEQKSPGVEFSTKLHVGMSFKTRLSGQPCDRLTAGLAKSLM